MLEERSEDVAKNNNFDVEFVLSSRHERGQREKHLVIMVNGFMERNNDLYLHPETGLAAQLAKRGVASAFVPLPFHLSRLPRTERTRKKAVTFAKRFGWDDEDGWSVIPGRLVRESPERFYLGYRQLISDVRLLAASVRFASELKREGHPASRDEYGRWFDQDTKIHLLGYSFGGLGCLAAFLKSRSPSVLEDKRNKDEERKQSGSTRPGMFYPEAELETCTLLNSGASFLDLDPRHLSVGMGAGNWIALQDYYFSRAFEAALKGQRLLLDANDLSPAQRQEVERTIEHLSAIRVEDSVSHKLFARVVLGMPGKSTDLEDASHRVLAVVGTRDRVVPAETLLRVRPEERSFCVVQVPKLDHAFFNDEGWSDWAPYVVGVVAEFLDQHPG